MSSRRRLGRGAIIGIAVALVVVLGAGVALGVWLTGRGDSPEAGAQRYLDALAAGDAAGVRASSMDGSSLSAETLDAFVSAREYIGDPAVTSTESTGNDAATVSASYDIAGESLAVSFTVREEGGRWLADPDALGAFALTTSIGDAVRIGTVVFETSETFVALPAAYDISAAPEGVLTGSASAVATPGATTDVAIEAALAPDADALAQPAVDAYLEACTSSSAVAPAPMSPASCGISVPWGADLASAQGFVFRVETLPTVALDPSGGFIATGGSYVVTVSGTTREGTTDSFTYRDDAWTLRGALTFDAGELVLQAW